MPGRVDQSTVQIEDDILESHVYVFLTKKV
jgi:hypothetical protein